MQKTKRWIYWFCIQYFIFCIHLFFNMSRFALYFLKSTTNVQRLYQNYFSFFLWFLVLARFYFLWSLSKNKRKSRSRFLFTLFKLSLYISPILYIYNSLNRSQKLMRITNPFFRVSGIPTHIRSGKSGISDRAWVKTQVICFFSKKSAFFCYKCILIFGRDFVYGFL
jgi:hypothetical protein